MPNRQPTAAPTHTHPHPHTHTHTLQDAHQLLRFLSSEKLRSVHWRLDRPYMLADSYAFRPEAGRVVTDEAGNKVQLASQVRLGVRGFEGLRVCGFEGARTRPLARAHEMCGPRGVPPAGWFTAHARPLF